MKYVFNILTGLFDLIKDDKSTDGGAANSLYLASQNIDGGGA